MRRARSSSLLLVTATSTMRLPCTLPRRTITPVESKFRAILVAVPALSRVEPASNSGPVSKRMSMEQGIGTCSAGTQAMAIARAPIAWACSRAPST